MSGSPDRLKIAVVGLGVFGRLHAETLQRLEGGFLAALVETDEAGRNAATRDFAGTPVFASLEALIEARAADAVIIATRAATHLPLSIRAMEAGLDVFVEKPAAESEEEVEALIAAQRKSGRVAMVDHICLFHSLIDPMLRRVAETGFRAAHFVRHRPAALARRFPEAHPLHLLMVHDFYIAARLVDGEEPCEWHLMESASRPGENADMVWVALRWRDGRTATFQSHCTLPPSAPSDGWDRIELFGEGFHSLVQTNPAPWQWQGAQPEWPIALEISSVQGRPTGMLAEAQRSFIAALRGTPVPPGCRLEDALQVERWTARILQARV